MFDIQFINVTFQNAQDNVLLMVVGGYFSQKKVQLIDLSGSHRGFGTPADFTGNGIQFQMGTYINGKPIVCGGLSSTSQSLNECYSYDNNVSNQHCSCCSIYTKAALTKC